jgi:hypothetical protein
MPPRDYRVPPRSFAKPVWDANGTKLIYRTFDDEAQPKAISLWEAGTRASRVVLTSSEGFSSAVISGMAELSGRSRVLTVFFGWTC